MTKRVLNAFHQTPKEKMILIYVVRGIASDQGFLKNLLPLGGLKKGDF